MDIRMSVHGVVHFVSGSFFNVADCVAVLVATPAAVLYIDPFLSRSLGRAYDHRAKFSLGILLAFISVGLAAHIELWRKEATILGLESNCSPPGVHMSAMGAAWIAPCYF